MFTLETYKIHANNKKKNYFNLTKDNHSNVLAHIFLNFSYAHENINILEIGIYTIF